MTSGLLGGVTDCHMHVFDHHYPWASTSVLFPPERSIDDYEVVMSDLGVDRHVLVQPSSYGTDNRLLVETLRRVGRRARGIAVVHPDIDESGLDELHDSGVRGVRLNFAQAGATTWEMVGPLAERVAPRGWHLQVHAPAEDLIDADIDWSGLPCHVVFDHLGRVPQPSGTGSRVFELLADLLSTGRIWVKLSAPYMDSIDGAPTFADSLRVVAAFVETNANRLVWGSDWPHVTEEHRRPDDKALFDALLRSIGGPDLQRKILVDNPSELYFT